ncbi:MAG TPA: hypothetical protein VFM37_01410, partial [Pseudonocardiaceae bacterium]|nr:hypothetical protein [Pseudonocardiaceae bacterium]
MNSSRIHAQISFYAGVGMTLAGNGLAAAPDGLISLGIGLSAPLALLLVFEMTTRTPAKPSRRRWHHRAGRIVPCLAIMGLTGWMSFGHLWTLAIEHGQSGWWAVLPDALMVVASSVLRDAPASRTRRAAEPTAPAPEPVTLALPAPAPASRGRKCPAGCR